MDEKSTDSPAVCQSIPAYRKKKAARCAWAEDTHTDDHQSIPAYREKKTARCAWAEDTHTDDHQRIPAYREKKTARCAWTEDTHTDDHQRIPAFRKSVVHCPCVETTNIVDLRGIPASRRKAVCCAWAGDDSSDDLQRTPANNADEVRRIAASRKKASRQAWAEGGNTDAQTGDVMTDVKKLSATINTTKVCAVALRPSSSSPTRPAARRMNAWGEAISNRADEAAKAAALHGPRSLQRPPSSSTAWACRQLAISGVREKAEKPLSEGSGEQEPLVLIDVENDQAATCDRYKVFQELLEVLEAGIKKLDDKQKIYSEVTQKAAVSGVAGPATVSPAVAPTVQADTPCVRMRVIKNKEYEAHHEEYPVMSDFSEVEEIDKSEEEAICRELVEALEDCAKEVDEKIKQCSRLISCSKTETQMVSVAVGPDGLGVSPVTTAAAPWVEASSSGILKKKTLPPLTQQEKKGKKAGKKSKWFRSLLCCISWLPCIRAKSSKKCI